MTIAPRGGIWGRLAWLLLAVILAHAVAPLGSPVRAASGSAFSAFTSDVSLGPSRPAPQEKERRYQKASGGADNPGDQAAALAVPSTPLDQSRPPAGEAAIAGPPLLRSHRLLARSLGARAPPLS